MLDAQTQDLAERCHARMLADPLHCRSRITIRRQNSDLEWLTAFREALEEFRDIVGNIGDHKVGELAGTLMELENKLDEARDLAGAAAEQEYQRELDEDTDPRDEQPLAPWSPL